MQFRMRDVDPIVSGTLTVSFRRWRRPQAKVGGRYRIIGNSDSMIEIASVDQVTAHDITQVDAEAAGATSPADVLNQITKSAPANSDPAAPIYRVRFRYIGEQRDPRLELGLLANMDDSEVETLGQRLSAMDRRSRRGDWTLQTLRIIGDHPGRRAADLAEAQLVETRQLKADVRKLKALGLTVSREVGYELSPRGAALLKALADS